MIFTSHFLLLLFLKKYDHPRTSFNGQIYKFPLLNVTNSISGLSAAAFFFYSNFKIDNVLLYKT